MGKYEARPEILLDQHEITPKIMMKIYENQMRFR